MNIYRICPRCQEKNGLGIAKCRNCKEDLRSVPIISGEGAQSENDEKKQPVSAVTGNEPADATNGCASEEGRAAAHRQKSAPSQNGAQGGEESRKQDKEADIELYAVDGLVRICDNQDCGAVNTPAMRKCRLCGLDIGHVPPTSVTGENDTRQKNGASDTRGKSAEEKPEKKPEEKPRVAKNEEKPEEKPRAAKNRTKGSGNSGVTLPTYPTELNQAVSLGCYLDAFEGGYSFRIPEGETVIGRAAAMSDYLVTKPYVSRIHCKLILEDGALYVINLSRVNYTYCNGDRIGDRLRLRDGDELGLGGILVNGKPQSRAAYFRVRIRDER